MSDVGPYGVTQNADAEAMTANALVGERVSPTTGNATVGSAALFSTAPYKGGPKVPPKQRSSAIDRDIIRHENDLRRRQRELENAAKARAARGWCKGKDGQCQAGPVKGTEYCIFHTPKEQREPPATP